jgi:hypothetical protein
MTKVVAGDRETVIEVGTGITIGVRNEGPYRINWANVDGTRYVHKEIYDVLAEEKDKLSLEFKKMAKKYGEMDEKLENVKLEKEDWKEDALRLSKIATVKAASAKRWKTSFIVMFSGWLLIALALIIVI